MTFCRIADGKKIMTAIIIRILLIIAVLWGVRRVLASLIGSISGKTGAAKNDSADKGKFNVMVKDPVCGMYMDARLAVRLEHQGESLHFCSEECRTKYLAKQKGIKSTPK